MLDRLNDPRALSVEGFEGFSWNDQMFSLYTMTSKAFFKGFIWNSKKKVKVIKTVTVPS